MPTYSLKTRILILKIILGSAVFVLSLIATCIVFIKGVGDVTIPLLIIVTIVCLICEILLGKLGDSIMESKLPG